MSKRPTDDLEPSSKRGKRGNDRQITKDEASEESDEEVPGEIKKASAETMKARRVVRARRAAAPSEPAAGANPFATLALITGDSAATSQPAAAPAAAAPLQAPAAAPAAAAASGAEGPSSHQAQQQQQQQPALQPAKSTDSTKAIMTAPPAGAAPSTAEAKPPDANAAAATALPASNQQPAASTAAAPSAEAAAPIAASAPAQSTAQSQPTPSTSSPPIFGGFAGFGKAGGFSSVSGAGSAGFGGFGASTASAFAQNGTGAGPALPGFGSLAPQDGFKSLSGGASSKPVLLSSESPPKTGEEDETCVWHGEGALFEFAEGWRERGRGELRVNAGQGADQAPGRLVMRSRGNLRLLLNAPLWPQMVLTPMESAKGATFACVNAAAHRDEGHDSSQLATFAFRAKDVTGRDGFMAAVAAHKGKSEAS